MRAHTRPRFGTHQPSRASVEASLVTLLCNCTDERFAALTLDDLCRRHSKLPRAQVERHFEDAKARRANRCPSAS